MPIKEADDLDLEAIHDASASKAEIVYRKVLTRVILWSQNAERPNEVRSMKIVAGAILVGLGMMSLWNVIMSKRAHASNPVPGSFYRVNGRQMHIYCSGAGSPTVVIEAAASASWLAWQAVQTRLAKVTQVCTYDRAGHGWSEPRSGPRDAEAIVSELHSLLNEAGVQRPLVLAGHSAGGLYVREYARQFPNEVAGVVLIDSSSPQQIDELPEWRADYEKSRREFGRQLLWQRLKVWSGFERLAGRCHDQPSKELEYLSGQYDALMCRPAFVGGEDSEFMYFETTCKQAGRLNTFGEKPVLVLSRDTEGESKGASPATIASAKVWDAEQEQSKLLSKLSWRVVAKGAGHGIHHDRLDLVVSEMTGLIEYLHGNTTPPFGGTVVE